MAEVASNLIQRQTTLEASYTVSAGYRTSAW
jgi:hypothetical protein